MANMKDAMCTLIEKAKPDENLAAVCFQIIDRASPDEKAQLMSTFFQSFNNRLFKYKRNELLSIGEAADDSCFTVPLTFAPEEKDELISLHGVRADHYMVSLQKKGLSEAAFYAKLWSYLKDPTICSDFKACAAILYNWAIDSRLPYIDCSSAIKMENDEFRYYIQAIGEEKLNKLRNILISKQFEQRTERASLVLQMLEEIPDYKARCVFMAQLIQYA